LAFASHDLLLLIARKKLLDYQQLKQMFAWSVSRKVVKLTIG